MSVECGLLDWLCRARCSGVDKESRGYEAECRSLSLLLLKGCCWTLFVVMAGFNMPHVPDMSYLLAYWVTSHKDLEKSREVSSL